MHQSVSRPVFFKTTDGVRIAGQFWSSDSKKAVLLVHQFNNSKESYFRLAELLNQNHFGVLAIDLRGHGQSKTKGTLSSPLLLQPVDFQNMNLDLLASTDFLKQNGFLELYLVGASIGANLAIIFPAQNRGFKAAVALSPGLDYKSLAPKSAAQRTLVPTLLVASSEDDYSFQTVQELDSVMRCEHQKLELSTAGHGTIMLAAQPQLSKKIVDWFVTH